MAFVGNGDELRRLRLALALAQEPWFSRREVPVGRHAILISVISQSSRRHAALVATLRQFRI
jgi:hypothetical protein